MSGGLARHVVLVEGRPENVDDPFCSPTRWLIVPPNSWYNDAVYMFIASITCSGTWLMAGIKGLSNVGLERRSYR